MREQDWLPLYEGKMVGMYDHRSADVVFNPSNRARRNQPVSLDQQEHADPTRTARPLFWIPQDVMPATASTPMAAPARRPNSRRFTSRLRYESCNLGNMPRLPGHDQAESSETDSCDCA